jgi:hypothetical protein
MAIGEEKFQDWRSERLGQRVINYERRRKQRRMESQRDAAKRRSTRARLASSLAGRAARLLAASMFTSHSFARRFGRFAARGKKSCIAASPDCL